MPTIEITQSKAKKKTALNKDGFFWGEIWDSNPRPPGPQPGALTN